MTAPNEKTIRPIVSNDVARVLRTTYRSVRAHKDLLTIEGPKITVHIYDADCADLSDLIEACEAAIYQIKSNYPLTGTAPNVCSPKPN